MVRIPDLNLVVIRHRLARHELILLDRVDVDTEMLSHEADTEGVSESADLEGLAGHGAEESAERHGRAVTRRIRLTHQSCRCLG